MLRFRIAALAAGLAAMTFVTAGLGQPGPAGGVGLESYQCDKCQAVFEAASPPSRCPKCNTKFGYIVDEQGNKTWTPTKRIGTVLGVLVIAGIFGVRLVLWLVKQNSPPPKRKKKKLRPRIEEEDDEEEGDRPRRTAVKRPDPDPDARPRRARPVDDGEDDDRPRRAKRRDA